MSDPQHEIFVISDLHIGGRYGTPPDRGFRINSHVPLLAAFVRRLVARRKASAATLELVINGDFIDFLAEEGPEAEPWRAFIDDADAALDTYRRIRERDSDFFLALRELLAGGSDITLLLGNHDIELGFPALRAQLQEDLGVSVSSGRLKFIYDGEACVRGDVLIEHGNRYDGFNVIDHDRLRRVRSAMSRRQAIAARDGFEPPPGSRLVAQVMNPLKKSYGFVDLLKPETEAVVPLLLALEPGLAGDITRLWQVWRLKSEADRLGATAPGRMARAGHIGTAQPAGAMPDPLRSLLGGCLDSAQLARLEALVAQARPDAGARRIGVLDTLRDSLSLLGDKLSGLAHSTRMDVLFDALRALQNDASFDTTVETPELSAHVRQLAASGFRTVIFGHTHLAREVPLGEGATYINTGTWADLMRLPAALFTPEPGLARDALEVFVADLRQHDYSRYLIFRPTFAHVVLSAGCSVSARLHTFDPAATAYP
jgi:UDP-2,3-diacylglucosamine pyrophosphatase LpxH